MASLSSSAATVSVVSQWVVLPDRKSTIGDLKLSASDLPMLSCHYIQKGCLFHPPPVTVDVVVRLLKRCLSLTLSLFPPLAGRLSTDQVGHVYVSCNDAGALFLHAVAVDVAVSDVLGPVRVPECVKGFFALDRTVSYQGHFQPIMAVQVTELKDGIFVGCTVNHAVVDGTSFWNFFNTFAEVCRAGCRQISPAPDFTRDSVLISDAVLKVPPGGPTVTIDENAPLAERIFSFSPAAILQLKGRVNRSSRKWRDVYSVEITGGKVTSPLLEGTSFFNGGGSRQPTAVEISSFQSLCALLWKCVTRARQLPADKRVTFRMAVNCRHRLEPALDAHYFGNAIQSIPTYALAGDVISRDLRWCAEQLNKNILAYDCWKVKQVVEDWEKDPRCFPLGNFDGGMITMGSSPRSPMYDNDFGWGRPMAVRSGRANKFDGKFSAFPGREGGGSTDIEVVLSPQTMASLEADQELMQYVSN
ncbi:hypothetical protein SAY86_030859 [Trapa natans]|uniref:BAHD acyltransferase DCR n=1 Tax=Trapa natans TaxID=22666 RepID=A0AAN7MSZ2_TRANT|nr:hypothetical protein SAY86_030859 [Trapa natans]